MQIVSGRKDPFVPTVDAEWLHGQLPNSELEVFDCGHFVWEDEAEAFVQICRNWFKRDFLLNPIKPGG